jgi:hypothetical protein
MRHFPWILDIPPVRRSLGGGGFWILVIQASPLHVSPLFGRQTYTLFSFPKKRGHVHLFVKESSEFSPDLRCGRRKEMQWVDKGRKDGETPRRKG